jgi:hypothetical protein
MPHPTFEEKVEEILDDHAILYSRTTMQYILDGITIEERDKEWTKSDLKAKEAILAAHKEEVERIFTTGFLAGRDAIQGNVQETDLEESRLSFKIFYPDAFNRDIDSFEQRQRAGLGE